MNRSEWLESRRRGLGGSDVGQIPSIVAACGGDPETDCAPWGSEWRVWWSKVHGDELEQRDSRDLESGRWLEEPVLAWAREQLGGEAPPVDLPMCSSGALCGTPDGWIHRGDEIEGLEAKVAAGWHVWQQEEIPFYYRLQVMTYLEITRAPRWHLAVYFRQANKRQIYTIDPDPGLQEQLVKAADAWWGRHVVEGSPPDADASTDCARALGLIYPRTAGASFADFRIATDEEVRLCADIARAEAVQADLDSDIREHRNRLRLAIGDAPGLRWTGGSARWTRNNLKIKIKE